MWNICESFGQILNFGGFSMPKSDKQLVDSIHATAHLAETAELDDPMTTNPDAISHMKKY